MKLQASRRAVTLVEILVGLAVTVVISGAAYGLMRFGIVSVGQTVTPQVGLQTASRKAMVDFIREIQEAIEIARPVPGSTLTYFVARDKTNCIVTAYLARNDADSTTAGRDIYDLYLNRKDFAGPSSQRKMLTHVERVTFTALSPGLIQVHLDVNESGKSYAMLTAVRCRNILGEGRL